MDEDNCELEEAVSYNSKIGTDSELQKRILGILKILYYNNIF
jgi:hypothetical protein